MKKLMIAAAIVCAAAFAQASNFKWSGNYIYNGYLIDSEYGGDVTAYATGGKMAMVGGLNAYLINAALIDQAGFAEALQTTSFDTLVSTYGVSKTSGNTSAAVTGGAIAETSFASTAAAVGSNLNAFFVLMNEENTYMYASDIKPALATESVSPSDFSFGNQAANAMKAGVTSGAGWYAAVPEPTSGLLLLLGVAGLALKRKRA